MFEEVKLKHKFRSAGVLFILFVIVLVFAFWMFYFKRGKYVEMPYDKNHPVIYDNDDTRDVYTDEYLMALASAGDIKLLGMITSSSIRPFNKYVSGESYERMVVQRLRGVEQDL